MRAAARIAIALPLVGVLGFAGSTAITIAKADARVRAASVEMASWSSRSALPDPGTWQSVREQLESAERMLPDDPTTHELRGLLGSMRGDSPEESALGIAHFHKALELRPVSPYTWANLGEAQYRRGEPGRNMEIAFRRASELGPAEPGVQRTVAHYGLAVWDEISAPTQVAIDRLLGAGFRRNPLEMLLISERRGRLDTACRHWDGDSRTPDPTVISTCRGRETSP